jgi:hypothetical protein
MDGRMRVFAGLSPPLSLFFIPYHTMKLPMVLGMTKESFAIHQKKHTHMFTPGNSHFQKKF